MQKRTSAILIGFVLIGTVVIAGAGIAGAGSGDDDATDTPITGVALERASEAALDYTGDGVVTETEVGDEESYYEVEVTLSDGSQVDVQLDEAFNVASSEADDDTVDD
jgi:hypothetical protein